MDNRLFYLLDRSHRKLFRHLDQRCQQALGLSLPQLGALLFIDKQPGCQQKQLAEALTLNKSAVTGLLNRMEDNGLIERRADLADARALCVYATRAGRRKAQAAQPLIQALNQRLADAFTATEIDTVLRFLRFIEEDF